MAKSDPPLVPEPEVEPDLLDRIVLIYLRDPLLRPVAIVLVGHAVAIIAPAVLLAVRDRRFAALGALLLMIAGTVSGVRYELRERGGAGAFTALLAVTWAASIAAAWAADYYGIF